MNAFLIKKFSRFADLDKDAEINIDFKLHSEYLYTLVCRKGNILDYIKKDNYYITDTQQLAQEHDRQIIEESFADSETGRTVSEEEMRQEFGKYGWGK